ncbi:MAG: 2-(1,2-epoxy-1,2-dihydrophenyl)acetyl-CoA isomerase [Chloroflexi bacterium]|nr:2-(1,2-epoxy-1,2-dihydrophenyl)acetyl-CoA isomerase [Chloroflexota bacterium]
MGALLYSTENRGVSYTTILYNIEDGVATITFNRPDKYNAFNDEQILETTRAFKDAGRDSAVRAIVLTGAGKAFCAGQDLGDVQERNVTFLEHLRDNYNPLILQMRKIEKPIIGALNGAAAGAGLSVALACDLRIISMKATLVFASFSRVGLIPDNGITYYLPRLVGPAKAFELLILADAQNRIGAEQAVAMGLCTKAVEPDVFMDEVQATARQLAALPTKALGLTKRMLNASWDSTLEEMLDMEAQLQEAASRTEDYQEGLQAFLEKRPPQFKGR